MKNSFKVLFTAILIFTVIFTACKKDKDEIIPEEKAQYIDKIFKDENLLYEFVYEEKELVYVLLYSFDEQIYTFYIDSGNKIYDKHFGNRKFEYDEQGRCIKITYYKSLPDSIFCFMNLFYESDNLSGIDWYCGDGNYAGNFTYQYDTSQNALYVLNKFYDPGIYSWKYQQNHCIEQNSDVENEDGYAWMEFAYSYEYQSPTDIYIGIILLLIYL